MKKFLLALFAVLPLIGCASPSQVIELNPQPTIHASPIGNNKTVALQVIDARAQSLQSQYAGATIDPRQNIAQLFTSQISKGLTAYGFNPTTAPNAQQNRMIVKILQINYGLASSVLGSNSATDVAAEVDVTSSAGTYRKTYYAHSYSDNYLSARENASEQVNAAVNKLLNDIINDQALMQFLAA